MDGIIAKQIIDTISSRAEEIKKSFLNSPSGNVHTRYVAIDNLLPEKLAYELYNAFPKDQASWRLMNSMRERKATTKNFDQEASILREVSFAFQNKKLVELIGNVTELEKIRPDPTYYAGGLSMMTYGDFLNPHLDNSHDGSRKLYRRLNLLYYVSPDWKLEDGGNLELWDNSVKEKITIPSLFNRLVLMETNKTSWHSVSPVKAYSRRCCVSNYYFSEINPYQTDEQYFHITRFNARPEEPFKRAVCKIDNGARTLVRKFIRLGLGKKDVYQTEELKSKN